MSEPGVVPMVEASFACVRCGRVAARVVVVPPGRPLPRMTVGRQVAGPVSLPFFDDSVRVLVDALGFGGSIGGSSVELRMPAIVAALEGHDAEGLHAADPEVGRFWCPACRATYCGSCWRLWDEFDPDDPAWFEEQRGECPAGHERMIID